MTYKQLVEKRSPQETVIVPANVLYNLMYEIKSFRWHNVSSVAERLLESAQFENLDAESLNQIAKKYNE